MIPSIQTEPAGTSRNGKVASSANQFPSAYFRHRGRSWRLYKRSDAADAVWYFLFHRRKQRQGPWSMGTSLRALAEVEAKLKIDLYESARHAELRHSMERPSAGVRLKGCALSQIETILPRLTIKASEKTRREYFANLLRILPHAIYIPVTGPRSVMLGSLDDDAGARFFAWVETEAVKLVSQVERNRFRRSWCSMFENALAIFAPRAEYQFRKTFGLEIPDLKDWRNAVKNHGPQLPRESGAAVPDDAIIRRTLGEWAKLGRTPGYLCRNRAHRTPFVKGKRGFIRGPLSELDRRNMFFAVGLELSCGLRKSEIPKVLWGWHKVFHGVPHLSELNVNVKNATGQIHVVPVDPFWNFMLGQAARNGWLGAAGEPMLVARSNQLGKHAHLQFTIGGHTDATYWPFAHIGWWLRDLGWKTQKTNHALRDFTASMLTMRYDLGVASGWCRHGDLATTRRSYNGFVTLGGKVNRNKLLWLRWAKVPDQRPPT